MAANSYERALEKQQRAEKTYAQNTALRERANSVVSGQQTINGLRIMDSSSEEVLAKLLEHYDQNESNKVFGSFIVFPEYIQQSLRFQFEKLNMYGMIAGMRVMGNSSWALYLTPQSKTYFADKLKAFELTSIQKTVSAAERKEYDVFISHASKDKLEYVDGLYLALRKLGIRIFYDSEVLSWGDNWKQVILGGTAKSEFAIIVISKNFFDREWTERELNEFLQRQNEGGQKIILPLLYQLSFNDLKDHYPELETTQSIRSSDKSLDEIAILLAKELIKRYR